MPSFPQLTLFTTVSPILHTHLEDFLHSSGYIVVFLSHDVGVHDPRGRVQRIHRRVDTQLWTHTHTIHIPMTSSQAPPTRDSPGEYGCGVEMSEGGSGGGVSEIVSGDKHRLN